MLFPKSRLWRLSRLCRDFAGWNRRSECRDGRSEHGSHCGRYGSTFRFTATELISLHLLPAIAGSVGAVALLFLGCCLFQKARSRHTSSSLARRSSLLTSEPSSAFLATTPLPSHSSRLDTSRSSKSRTRAEYSPPPLPTSPNLTAYSSPYPPSSPFYSPAPSPRLRPNSLSNNLDVLNAPFPYAMSEAESTAQGTHGSTTHAHPSMMEQSVRRGYAGAIEASARGGRQGRVAGPRGMGKGFSGAAELM